MMLAIENMPENEQSFKRMFVSSNYVVDNQDDDDTNVIERENDSLYDHETKFPYFLISKDNR